MRRRLAWGLGLPLALAGTQAAHIAAYAVVYPEAGIRSVVLSATGHAYFAWLPVVLAVAGACALLTFVAAVSSAARGRIEHAAPAWVFALLAPTVFVLQEVLELSLHSGGFGWRAVTAPTFLPGLALQLPFSLLAYAAARLLLRAAARLARALAAPPRGGFAVVSFGLRAAPRLRCVALGAVAARGPPRVVGI
jgi:hypothetical protein